MAFPLFRMPLVVLIETIHSMELGDLTCFALSSRNSYRVAKSLRRKSSELTIHITNRSSDTVNRCHVKVRFRDTVLVKLDVNQYPENGQEVKIQGSKVAFLRTRDIVFLGGSSFDLGWETLAFNYEDPVLGLKSLVQLAQDLFSSKISRAELDKRGLWVSDWVDSQQQSLWEAQISSTSELTAEEYGYLLGSNKADRLFLYATPPPQFWFSGEFKPRELCVITEGDWITVDNLIAMNSDVIGIDSSNLTSSDINRFLKAWINGDIPRTRWIDVSVENFDFETALDGLGEVKAADGRVVQEMFDPEEFITFTSTHEIRQANGVKASIGYQSGIFYFSTN